MPLAGLGAQLELSETESEVLFLRTPLVYKVDTSRLA